MISVLVYRDGAVQETGAVDPGWIAAGAAETVWVDLTEPDEAEAALLRGTFRFHELAIEDALAEVHHPKIETYGELLYLILHAIEAGKKHQGFVTHDVDFFLGANYLVTVHQSKSRSIDALWRLCVQHPVAMSEGPVGLLHRLVDRIVHHYGPEVEGLEARLERLEGVVFGSSGRNPLRDILDLNADIASLRRVTLPQRDALSRLARREFPQVSEAFGYRFRDVYDQLVRLSDESMSLQDRVTGLIDAHVSIQSNRLNGVMKVLTVIATIFMPLTVLTSMFGMNVTLPALPGGPEVQFWGVAAIMTAISAVMLWVFRRMDWL